MGRHRGTCHVCRGDIAVRKDGNVAKHPRVRAGSRDPLFPEGAEPCPGSGIPPGTSRYGLAVLDAIVGLDAEVLLNCYGIDVSRLPTNDTAPLDAAVTRWWRLRKFAGVS